MADGGEAVLHDRLCHLVIQRRRFPGHAEGPIRHAPPCPPGDLRQFVRGQHPHPPPVELGERGEGDMVDVQVQPHADGVRCHQIVHIAILVERDLRVARPGGKRAHHHRRPTLLASDQFGDSIDIIN